jgi:hypothetical protein
MLRGEGGAARHLIPVGLFEREPDTARASPVPVATCAIMCDRVLASVGFDAPGLTTFYHKLAAARGGDDYWRARVSSYLAIPNPINMCNRHLGRVFRVHMNIASRTDTTHVVKCLLGSSARLVNWVLAGAS